MSSFTLEDVRAQLAVLGYADEVPDELLVEFVASLTHGVGAVPKSRKARTTRRVEPLEELYEDELYEDEYDYPEVQDGDEEDEDEVGEGEERTLSYFAPMLEDSDGWSDEEPVAEDVLRGPTSRRHEQHASPVVDPVRVQDVPYSMMAPTPPRKMSSFARRKAYSEQRRRQARRRPPTPPPAPAAPAARRRPRTAPVAERSPAPRTRARSYKPNLTPLRQRRRAGADPVSRYHTYRQEWSKSRFLKRSAKRRA